MFEGLDDMGEENSEDERGSEADDDNQEESYDISNNDRDGSQNDNGFVFDASDQDFNRYGDMEGEDATDEDISDEEVSENQDDNDQNEHDEEEEEEEKDDSALGISSVGSNVTSEIKKGKCVARQLKFWDKLLETRIQEQKILTKVNSLPVGGYWGKIVNAGDVEVQEA